MNNEELPLGDETPGTKEELPLGDKTPGTITTTTPNLQGCGRTTTTKITATRFTDTAIIMDTSRIMDTARTMVITTNKTTKKTPNLQGWGERSRLLLRNIFLCFHKNTQPPLKLCVIKRDRATVIWYVRKREQGGLDKNDWEF